MSKHQLHPDITYNLRSYNLSSLTEEKRKQLISDYESGHIIILKEPNFDIDLEIFNQISPPNGPFSDHKLAHDVAKLKEDDYNSINFSAPSTFKKDRVYTNTHDYMRFGIFKDDINLRDTILQQLRIFRESVERFKSTVFNEYEVIKTNYACRLTGAYGQSVHIDAYESGRHFNQIKLFMNVDDAPRLWCTGEITDILIDHFYDQCGFSTDKNLDYQEFLKIVDAKLFGKIKRQNMTEDELNDLKGNRFKELSVGSKSLHSHFFAPGDIWLAETRLIPHQIVYGEKMLSAQLNTTVESMLDPDNHISTRVEKIHQKYC